MPNGNQFFEPVAGEELEDTITHRAKSVAIRCIEHSFRHIFNQQNNRSTFIRALKILAPRVVLRWISK